jgi:hypothetical protein
MGGVAYDHRWLGGIVRVTLLLLGAATWGCPGTLDDPGRFLDAGGAGAGGADSSAPVEGDGAGAGGSCPDVPGMLAKTCTASTCHNASTKAQGLDLQSSDVAARLVGVPATEGAGVLIDPSTPTHSVLYAKLTENPPFGARMPLGLTPLDAPTLGCVLAWVTQAADATGPDASSPKGAGTDAGSPGAASDGGGAE